MPDSLVTTAETPLQSLIAMGGPVMIVLIALAVLGLFTFFYLILTGALFSPRVTPAVRKTAQDWQLRFQRQEQPPVPALPDSRMARLNPVHGMARNAMNGIRHQEPLDQLRETLAQQAQKALQPFEAPLKIIEVIAALAPLLGLLGTVLGMMEAFSAMATTEGRASASQLSGGIYQALTTTAAGLIIAIPFAAVAAWAEFRLRRLNSGMNELLLGILNSTVTPPPGDASGARATRSQSREQAHDSDYSSSRVAHAAG